MKKKRNWKKIIIMLLMLIFIIIFIYSIINIIKWFDDNKKISKLDDEINEITEIKEIEDTDNTVVIEQDNIDSSNPYWDYIKMNLIDVDFSELLKVNKETVGWIKVNGTNINYPVVQAKDNDYYLTHAYDKSSNDAGWVFMDYRNNSKNFDDNTIIYAHGRYDTTMFGSLKNILTSKWYNNKNNYVVKFVTKYESTLWQVFSVYKIKTTNDYLDINLSDNKDEFLNMLIKRSDKNFNTTVNSNDKIITLSTCYNDTVKVVMHAKLIKKEKKS